MYTFEKFIRFQIYYQNDCVTFHDFCHGNTFFVGFDCILAFKKGAIKTSKQTALKRSTFSILYIVFYSLF